MVDTVGIVGYIIVVFVGQRVFEMRAAVLVKNCITRLAAGPEKSKINMLR